MYSRLQDCQHIRRLSDIIEAQYLLVFESYQKHMFGLLCGRAMSVPARRRILRDVLCGLAELHEKNIVHTGNCHPP